MSKGKLYILPGPIGDGETEAELPVANKRIMEGLKFYWAENPKPARAMLKAVVPDIKFEEIILFTHNKHDKKDREEEQEALDCLLGGNDVGLLSDVGCPGVADPGGSLVSMAHENNIEVVPLVGPSSILLALMGSGLNGQNFSFIGYLPKEQVDRIQEIKRISAGLKQQGGSCIAIETPYRVDHLLDDLIKFLDSDLYLSVSVDLLTSRQEVITRRVGEWKKEAQRKKMGKRQVVFVFGTVLDG